MIVAITGHRPEKLGGYYVPNPTYTKVVAGITDGLLKLQPSYVIIGMAQGVDQWAAEVCIQYGIPFIAAIPCDNFAEGAKWPPKALEKYYKILGKAYASYIISPGPYEHSKMQKRNGYMVDASNVLLAAWDGTPGGTANCIKYAKAVGRVIQYIPMPGSTVEPSTKGLLHTGMYSASDKPKFATINTKKPDVVKEKTKLSPFVDAIKMKAEVQADLQMAAMSQIVTKQATKPMDTSKPLGKMSPLELMGLVQKLLPGQDVLSMDATAIEEAAIQPTNIQNLLDAMQKGEFNALPSTAKNTAQTSKKEKEVKAPILGYKRVLED